MAIEFPGQTPTTTTVSASPTPTTTAFTVASATDFVVDQWVNVEVSAAFERVKITDISGSQLTVSPALSDVPDVPGEVRSTRTLIKSSVIAGAGVFNADDVADIKAVDFTYAPAGTKHFTSSHGVYQYDPGSSETGDDELVIDPTTGPGRTLLVIPSVEYVKYKLSGSLTDETQSGHGFAVGDMIKKNSGTWLKAQGDAWDTSPVWVVISVSGDDFTAQLSGRSVIPSHGWTVGGVYYLDPDTAGEVTSARPQNGLLWPLFQVKDSDSVILFGRGTPDIDPAPTSLFDGSGSTPFSGTWHYDLSAYSIAFDEPQNFKLSMYGYAASSVSLYVDNASYDSVVEWGSDHGDSTGTGNSTTSSSTGSSGSDIIIPIFGVTDSDWKYDGTDLYVTTTNTHTDGIDRQIYIYRNCDLSSADLEQIKSGGNESRAWSLKILRH